MVMHWQGTEWACDQEKVIQSNLGKMKTPDSLRKSIVKIHLLMDLN